MGRLIWGLRLIGIGMLAPIVAILCCSLPFIASEEWRFLLEPIRRGVIILEFLALGGGGLACASGPLTIPTRILLGIPPFLLLLGFAITQPCLVAAAVLFFTLGLNGVSREWLPEKLPMERLTVQIGLGLLCTFSGRDWAALGTVLLIGSGLMQLSAAYSTVLRQLLEREKEPGFPGPF